MFGGVKSGKYWTAWGALALAFACSSEDGHLRPRPRPEPSIDEEHPLFDQIPRGFPAPRLPEGARVTAPLVELGRHLFYDVRLSVNRTVSCASCHEQKRAFTDGKKLSVGATGSHTVRNSMTLANVAYASSLNWQNPLLTTLEEQVLIPLFSTDPIEMGLSSEEQLQERLQEEPRYERLFQEAFPEEDEPSYSLKATVEALGAFQRTLISGNSPFDRWIFHGEEDALSESAQRGYFLVNGHPMECSHCHVDFHLTDAVTYEGKPGEEKPFHNNGLYNPYPPTNLGIADVTGREEDRGRFRAPTLRNIAVTGPYMHDGSLETLEEVLEHYAKGGSHNPLQSSLLRGFSLSEQDKADLLAFFESLTDEEFLTNPRFANPWEEKAPAATDSEEAASR